MPALPRISETEWEIMKVVWDRHPIPAADIIERLTQADSSWHPVTAKTLLNRLVILGGWPFVFVQTVGEGTGLCERCECIVPDEGLWRFAVDDGGSFCRAASHHTETGEGTSQDFGGQVGIWP